MIDEQCSLSIEVISCKGQHQGQLMFDQVTKLRKDLEECRIQHDATLVSLKKKQADSIAEVRSNIDSFVFELIPWFHQMSEQMDQLNKMKAK